MKKIAITSFGSISPLGACSDEVQTSYRERRSLIGTRTFSTFSFRAASLHPSAESELAGLFESNPDYRHLDRTAQLAISAARKASGALNGKPCSLGVNFGSSRGATGLFERYHESFKDSPRSRSHPLTSPLTTLGNISSWVAHDLNTSGPVISHSVTCSTGAHALFNGIAWLKAKMTDKFLVGAAEAPLTHFTFSQMEALRIYTKDLKGEFPCRPFEMEQNTMALGEGAAAFLLELLDEDELSAKYEKILALIESIGYASEPLTTPTSISANGTCIKNAMSMALKNTNEENVDLIIAHAPGTLAGDSAELTAIRSLFGKRVPPISSNKWYIGHTLAPSALFSLEYAIFCIKRGYFEDFPYQTSLSDLQIRQNQEQINTVMINSAGFGGNATCIIVKKAGA